MQVKFSYFRDLPANRVVDWILPKVKIITGEVVVRHVNYGHNSSAKKTRTAEPPAGRVS